MNIFRFLFLASLIASQTAMGKEVNFPLEFDKKFNLPIVSLDIAGNDTLFVLDTGSQNGLHIPKNIINQIPGLIKKAKKQTSIDLSGQRSETETFLIEKMDINGLTFKKISGVEFKPWGFYYSSPQNEDVLKNDNNEPVYPIVGLSFFRDHIITIDFPDRKLIVDDGENFALNSNIWISLPFYYDEHEGIIISITDNLKEYKFALDSAASISFVKSQSLPKNAKINSNEEDNYQYIDVMLANQKTPQISVEAIVIDSLPNEFQADGLLGVNFLKKHLIKIDQKNKKLWFMPATSAVTIQ
jgi:hypothetical protein